MQSAGLLRYPEGCVYFEEEGPEALAPGLSLTHKEIGGCPRKALGPALSLCRGCAEVPRARKEQIRAWACPPRPFHPGSQPRGRLDQRALDWKPRKREFHCLPSFPHPALSILWGTSEGLRPGSALPPWTRGFSELVSSVLEMAGLMCLIQDSLIPLVLRTWTKCVSTPEPHQ